MKATVKPIVRLAHGGRWGEVDKSGGVGGGLKGHPPPEFLFSKAFQSAAL